MAFILNDRVKVTSTTQGTGVFALGSATAGFETFASGIGGSNTTYYAIAHQSSAEFEVGFGTLDSDGDALTRTYIINSSNSDAAVNFTAGTKDIFCTMPASKAVIEDADNDVSIGRHLTIGSQLRMPDNTSGKILVGDGVSYQEVAVSGDATLSSSGALTISGGVSQGFVIAMSVAL